MYLKRLESVGFKSFAERISVNFVPGMTAIVGPNGSGKSNITDAIKWVLGEQSAKSLRGSKMEDIIFQGSDTRKPLNVAEVTLTLDNKDQKLPIDYEEVQVTRRVYRSGESEFYINKQPCRLKDIIDLFMDSGLGREAFSIISQGKIEEILSSKSEERRTIFEEAAGVLKYKQRKKKAEYKLAETQENLFRVEDIIHEIEQQLEPLEEQANTAEKYLSLKDELKQEEISLVITEIETLHKEWQTLLAQIKNEKDQEIKMKTSIQQRESEIENKRLTVDKIDEEITRLQEKLLKTTERLEKYDGKKQLFLERVKHVGENKDKLEKLIQEAKLERRKWDETLKEDRNKLTELLQQRKEISVKIKQLEEKLSLTEESIADQIEELKSEYIEYLNKQAAIRNEKQSIEQQKQSIVLKKDRQASNYEDVLLNRETLLKEKEKTEKEFKEKEIEYTHKQEDIKGMKITLENDRNEFQQLQTNLYKGYQYIEKIKSKKEMLEDMKEDFQGFFQGVKAVLKARKQKELENIHGAVIELVDIPRDYITAIETVLGGQAQHIIVDDDYAARNAIQWLKRTNSGRATFLPLQSIQERFIPSHLMEKVKTHPGFIGVASNLIQAQSKYQKAVQHLMGHVIISNTLKDANEIANLVHRKYRIVTLEGDVVNPGGSMSGGALQKKNQSLFTRDKDIQELTEKLSEYQHKMVAFEQTVNEKKQRIKDIDRKLQTDEEQLMMEQQNIQQLKSKLTELELKLDSIGSNLYIYDQDQKQFTKDLNQLIDRDEKLEKDLTVIRQRLMEIQNEMDSLSEQETQLKDNRESLQNELHQLQITFAEIEQRVKNQKERVATSEEHIAELNNQLASYTNELETLNEVVQMTESEEEMEQIVINFQKEKERLTQRIQEKRRHRAKLSQYILDAERELKEENKNHQQFIQEIQEREVQANRLDVKLETHLNHLQTEYVITYEKACKLYEKTTDMEKSRMKVSELKTRIERLGTINLGAVDEFKRISERYHFLTEQRDDLVQAKETLYSVISEMDEEMTDRLGSTFSKIKAEFQVVFKQLFGGGRAELKLTDPKNLLETGVDIIAQPPGKKLQNLGLLSGGERSLTAISLLFAILRVRPVPFCILDEVEAALDEANVVRFAKYIKKHSHQTQFIVITHRKGTMEEADVLYGVTMQESGVSRLVSVRLEETKELISS